jgi:uncharacterized damage-inducible protein DinB
MKTTKEYLQQLIDSETPAFVRVLQALPADKMDWKPDPKASSAQERAFQIVTESGDLADVFEKGLIVYNPEAKAQYPSTAQMAEIFKAGMERAKNAIAKASDADWESEAKMMVGDKEAWKATKGEMGLGIMLDLIHHRGQISVYIRPMGGKVPSIYGPSADTTD